MINFLKPPFKKTKLDSSYNLTLLLSVFEASLPRSGLVDVFLENWGIMGNVVLIPLHCGLSSLV